MSLLCGFVTLPAFSAVIRAQSVVAETPEALADAPKQAQIDVGSRFNTL